VVSQAIEDVRVWMAAPAEGDWSLADALRRLGAAGVLRAAGAVAWG
jgi:hypothetical protein